MKKYNRFFIIIVSMLVVSLLVACKGKGNNDSSSTSQETEVSLMTTASVAATEPTLNQETEATKATTASVTQAPTTEYVTTTESTPKKIIADDYWDGDTFDVVSYCLDKGYEVTARDSELNIVDCKDKSAEYYYISIDEKWRINITQMTVGVYTKDFSFEAYVYTTYWDEESFNQFFMPPEAKECRMSAIWSNTARVEQFLLIEDNLLNNKDNPIEGIDEKFLVGY